MLLNGRLWPNECHPSSLPDVIPQEKRLFRGENIAQRSQEEVIRLVNEALRRFIWEGIYTMNDSNAFWKQDAAFLANLPLASQNLAEQLKAQIGRSTPTAHIAHSSFV